MDWDGTQNNSAFCEVRIRVIFGELDMTHSIILVWTRSAVESVERDFQTETGRSRGKGERVRARESRRGLDPGRLKSDLCAMGNTRTEIRRGWRWGARK